MERHDTPRTKVRNGKHGRSRPLVGREGGGRKKAQPLPKPKKRGNLSVGSSYLEVHLIRIRFERGPVPSLPTGGGGTGDHALPLGSAGATRGAFGFGVSSLNGHELDHDS